MGLLDDYLNGLGTLVANNDWRTDPGEVAQTLLEVGQVAPTLGELATRRALDVIAAATHQPLDRLQAMIRLGSVSDIQRSLNPDDKPAPRDELFPRYGWLWDYARHASGNEAHIRWHWWCGLTVLAAALKRNVYYDGRAFTVWPNMYVMIVEQAASKKTTAINIAKSVVKRMNKLMIDKERDPWELIGLAPESGSLASFIKEIQSLPMASKDALGNDVQGTSPANAFVVLDDLVTLFSKSSWQPEKWVESLTSWWDYKGDWRDSTLSKGNIVLRDPAISFLGGTTTEWLRDSVTSAMIGGGFISRCMYIVQPPEPKQLSDYYPEALLIDPVTELQLAERLLPLTCMKPRLFHIDDTWRTWYRAWYMDYMPSIEQRHPDKKLRAYYGRRSTTIVKLAMLLAVSEGKFIGNSTHLELADKIMAREEIGLEASFAGVGATKDAQLMDEIVAHLKARGTTGHSELMNTFYRKVGSSKRFKEIMESLLERNAVGRVKNHKPGGGMSYVLVK